MSPRTALDCPGLPTTAQDCPGLPRTAHDCPVSPRTAQDCRVSPRTRILRVVLGIHPVNDYADDLAKKGAQGEECYEGIHECIVKINKGYSKLKFGGSYSKTLADRYPELLSVGNDTFGRIVGKDGRNTYLVQWYVREAQKGCIYLHEGSEIEKLGNCLDATARASFSEEVRMGFPRLTINSQWAQELGEEGRAQPSPKRKHRGTDGDVRNSQSCQSQGDESGTNGDGIREEEKRRRTHK